MTDLPPTLLAYAARGPAWADWLDRLPRLLRELLAEWDLVPDGPAVHGRTAVVLPVRTADGEAAVLKAGWPHWEAEHEALALRAWRGDGAVRLLRADPHRWALLLERLDRRDLTGEWDVHACEVVAGLYGRLHVPASPQFRRLTDQTRRWDEELGRIERGAPVPRRLVEQARALSRDLAADPATDGTLLHTDLHFENVLWSGGSDGGPGGPGGADGPGGARGPGGPGGARGPDGPGGADGGWLAIDPKPLSGDPHYELAPMLWNELGAYAGRFRDGVRQRFRTLVEAAGLDEHRARAWVVVRMLVNVKEELLGTPEPDQSWITTMISIAKAVQD